MDDDTTADAETLRAEMRARIEQARKRHDLAQKVFERFINALIDLTDKIEAAKEMEKGEIDKTVRELSKSLIFATEEAEKYEKCVLENTGLVADAPLDLDAIRSEIGSRLDRLRATR